MLLAVQGDHARLEGRFQIADSLEVQCEVGGELEIGRRLVVGENATVRADVRTVNAVIRGTYEGNMIATGDVQVTSTGKVKGNVQTDSLVISEGGLFNGNVRKIGNGRPVAGPVQLADDGDDDDRVVEAFRHIDRA